MKSPFPAMYRLTARGGVGLACDEQGIALGPVILVEALAAGGGRVFRARPAEEIARTLAQAYDDLAPADIARCLASLDVAAKALEARDLAKASVAAVLLKLPDLSVEGFAKLAADPSLKKYSPTSRATAAADGPAMMPGAVPSRSPQQSAHDNADYNTVRVYVRKPSPAN